MQERQERHNMKNKLKAKGTANSATSKSKNLRIQEVEDEDSLFFRSGSSATPVVHQKHLDSQNVTLLDEKEPFIVCGGSSILHPPLQHVILLDEEEEQNLFCGSTITSPLLTQRGLTPLERGTTSEHTNSTNRTPSAHLCSFLTRLLLLSFAVATTPVYIGLDTMCWHHFTGDVGLLVHVQELTSGDIAKYETKVASGSQICPTHRGDLPAILRTVAGDTVNILFSDVLYAKNFDNLLSIGQLRSESAASPQPTFDWKENEGFLRFRFGGMKDWADVPHIIAHNCHYVQPLQCGPSCFKSKTAAAALPRPHTVTSKMAQRRLGFISPTGVKQTIANTFGVTLNDNPMRLSVQEASLHGMQHAAPLVKTLSTLTGSEHTRRHWTTLRYETLHIDLHGPYPPGFFNQVTSFMSYTTNNGVTWVTFLKSATATDLIATTQEAFTRLGTPRHIRTDNSMTLLSHDVATTTALTRFLVKEDVVLKISAPYCQW
jgi:hypothetical protein